jgi:hypothetical protein
MKKIFPFLALLTIYCFPASAAVIIDQNQPLFDDENSIINNFDDYGTAQSFRQSHANIAGAGLKLDLTTGFPHTTGEVTISLYDNLPSYGGNLIISGSATGESGSWVDVYWKTVSINPESIYYLIFTSTNHNLCIDGIIWSWHSSGDLYPDGQVYALYDLHAEPNLDVAFRTYYDDSFTPTPLPGTAWLLGSGLVGLIGLRRRMKK